MYHFEIFFKYAKILDIKLEPKDLDGRTPFHLLSLTRSETETMCYRFMAMKYDQKIDGFLVDNEGNTAEDLAQTRAQLILKER